MNTKIIKRIIFLCYTYLKYNTIYKIVFKKKTISIKFLKQLQKLGPIFIKIGQILGTRIDIFPKKILKVLNKLFSTIRPIKSKNFKNFFFKKSTNTYVYEKISNIPIATASISQVYTIHIKKKKFAIKILNKFSSKKILLDLKLLFIIKSITNFLLLTKIIKIKKVIDEITNTLKIEQNLKIEAINIVKQKKISLNNKLYIVPSVFNKNIKENTLITEYIKNIPLYKFNKLKKTKYLNKKNIIEKYVRIFFIQAFEHSIFHADMHPGNVLLNYNKRTKAINLVMIDFGIIGKLKNKEKKFMIKNLIAFITKDYKTIIRLHKNRKNKKTISLMENDLYYLLEPITNKNLKNISFKKIIEKFLFLKKKYNIEYKPQFLLFQKTLLTIEGVCRMLDENINLWNVIKKILRTIIKKKIFNN